MIDTHAVMRSLPLVASVLGQKYGVRVEIGGTEAFTDGRTIHLPALPADAPDTLLALVRGYLDHEAGHIRDTDFQALTQAGLSPVALHIWNTIEDWRVENKLSEMYPGCRGNFNWLIKHIFGSNAPQDSVHPAAIILNWLVLEVRTWDVPELAASRDSLADQVDSQFPGVREPIKSVLCSVQRSCRSTQDALHYAGQIVRILQQAASSEQTQFSRPESASYGDHDMDKRPSKSPPAESAYDPQGSGDDYPGNAIIPTHTATQEISSLLKAQEAELPDTLGSVLAASLEGLSRQSAVTDAITVARQSTKEATALSEQDIKDATQACGAMRTRLHGLLQTLVQTRSALGRKGRLDTRSLHRLAVSDPRVFRQRAQRQGVDTAVHVLLDCSGSMVRIIHLACTVCYAVGKALESMGMSVGITAFPGNPLADGSYVTIAPIVRHGQRMHALLDLSPAGGTPMGEALWWTMQDMLALPENRKIILIVTDGSPDSLVCAEKAIAAAMATGFEVYGIGIGSDCMASLLPQSRTIQNLSELGASMFALLQHALIP